MYRTHSSLPSAVSSLLPSSLSVPLDHYTHFPRSTAGQIVDTSSQIITAFDKLSSQLRGLDEDHLPLGIAQIYQVRDKTNSLMS